MGWPWPSGLNGLVLAQPSRMANGSCLGRHPNTARIVAESEWIVPKRAVPSHARNVPSRTARLTSTTKY